MISHATDANNRTTKFRTCPTKIAMCFLNYSFVLEERPSFFGREHKMQIYLGQRLRHVNVPPLLNAFRRSPKL